MPLARSELLSRSDPAEINIRVNKLVSNLDLAGLRLFATLQFCQDDMQSVKRAV